MDVDWVCFDGGYVLLYSDESLVALDEPSGGYPYKAHSLSRVKVWQERAEAERYMRMFSSEDFLMMEVVGLGLKRIDG
jgi:hypothetical protein